MTLNRKEAKDSSVLRYYFADWCLAPPSPDSPNTVDYPEDRGRKVPQIVGSLAPVYKTQHPKGSETLTAPPSECHISEQKSHMASDMTRNDTIHGGLEGHSNALFTGNVTVSG